MLSAETKQRFLRGELAIWSGGDPRLLSLVTAARLWRVSLDATPKPYWVQRFSLDDAEKHLFTAEHAVVPVADVPDGLGERLIAAASFALELEARYAKGGVWVPQGGGAYEGTHPVLGSVYASVGGSVSSRPQPFDTLFAWAWVHPGEVPGAVPEEHRAGVEAALAPFVALVEGARRDGKAVALGADGDSLLVSFEGSFFWLRGGSEAAVADILFNPRAAVLPFDKALDQMAYAGKRALVETPAAWSAALPRLAEELRLPKRAVVDRYIAMLRAGGSLGGGPTTDQRWTVRASGDGFVISGYKPTDDGGYERTSDPISEERVREMIGSYAMFGLRELADT